MVYPMARIIPDIAAQGRRTDREKVGSVLHRTYRFDPASYLCRTQHANGKDKPGYRASRRGYRKEIGPVARRVREDQEDHGASPELHGAEHIQRHVE